MFLSEIIEAIKPLAVIDNQQVKINVICNNSKESKPNSLFICVTGFEKDGHIYADEAVSKGAVAIITEKILATSATQLLVENSRLAQAIACHKFYNYPTSKLKLVGVTGTNGKTTISYLTEAILAFAGFKTGLISTINNKIGDKVILAKHTTPDSLELGNLFSQMVSAEVTAAVMEVSSHALELHRITGCDYYTTVFSNITRDHFDFHQNFSNYLGAKEKLFKNQCNWGKSPPETKSTVINMDDPYSKVILRAATAKNIITYGINSPSNIQAVQFHLKRDSSTFTLKIKNKYYSFFLPIPGLFNIYNALAAIAVGLSFGIDVEIIQEAISSFKGIPGRCEFINYGQNFNIMVDFAHNPSGLYNILATIPYPNSVKKKIVVFGCEGGKDPGKRSLMGSIAAKYADFCIITTDNIYKEHPLDIARDIEQGVLWGGMKSSQYKIILDRSQAISYALNIAQADDTVIIAGKGHESSQIIYNQIIPFDDREVVKKILMERKKC